MLAPALWEKCSYNLHCISGNLDSNPEPLTPNTYLQPGFWASWQNSDVYNPRDLYHKATFPTMKWSLPSIVLSSFSVALFTAYLGASMSHLMAVVSLLYHQHDWSAFCDMETLLKPMWMVSQGRIHDCDSQHFPFPRTCPSSPSSITVNYGPN